MQQNKWLGNFNFGVNYASNLHFFLYCIIFIVFKSQVIYNRIIGSQKRRHIKKTQFKINMHIAIFSFSSFTFFSFNVIGQYSDRKHWKKIGKFPWPGIQTCNVRCAHVHALPMGLLAPKKYVFSSSNFMDQCIINRVFFTDPKPLKKSIIL